MPFAENAGIRLYYECQGSGPPLVLHHGFTESGRDWVDNGYVNALRDRFRLILIDARGHGRSDKPADPAAYTMEQRARDVVAVLDNLGFSTAHFLGYSMGGRVGFAVGKHAPERFDSIIIGGASPSPDSRESLESWIEWLRRDGLEGVISGMERLWGPLPEPTKDQIRANDAGALLAERVASLHHASLDDALPGMEMPCLIYAGSKDPRYAGAEEAAARLPQGTFVGFAGLDHLQCLLECTKVVSIVTEFLSHVRLRA